MNGYNLISWGLNKYLTQRTFPLNLISNSSQADHVAFPFLYNAWGPKLK